uniref:Uncharacterized protein n=1 Tax=Tetraselmis sp. GSL018 TaxID=582737 RepID=A0A061RM69_9CHLO|eukprot:CAMPEP_0177579870 /NCGR_PEP_ID=MMETSP0419_2-20121207/1212_1 /TAXON_ID=582737 /ORGANISM="Tetraselmis sp., Strain GSL018" /LENGTH=350 /DNA_ID=CAMNT_0019068609 /DNA_START=87 /DNA_END=1139 /DNA_ORIENTATION=+
MVVLTRCTHKTVPQLTTGVTDSRRLKRAKGYPYERPPTSYFLLRETPYCFRDNAWTGNSNCLDIDLTRLGRKEQRMSLADALVLEDISWLPSDVNWTAVLAVGSNAGYSQLCRKFPPELFPDGVVIPVVKAVLRDFDVCYAPIVTSYGSVPATLMPSPGTSVEIFVNFLDDKELAHMHRTEGAYCLQKLSGIDLQVGVSLGDHSRGAEPAARMDSVLTYVHQHGGLGVAAGDGSDAPTPLALAEISASGRRFPSLSQDEAQAVLRHCLGDEGGALEPMAPAPAWDSPAMVDRSHSLFEKPGLDEWILRNLDDDEFRIAHVSRLTETAIPFEHDCAELLSSFGDAFSRNVE